MYHLNTITPIHDIPNKDIRAVNEALNTAYESNFHSSLRLGACIKNKKEYLMGPNMKGQTRFGKISRVSLHAEMNALCSYLRKEYGHTSFKQKPTKTNNYTVYVVRVMNSKKGLPDNQKVWFGCSKPCINCQTNLFHFGFKKIKYTDNINGQNVLCEMVKC